MSVVPCQHIAVEELLDVFFCNFVLLQKFISTALLPHAAFVAVPKVTLPLAPKLPRGLTSGLSGALLAASSLCEMIGIPAPANDDTTDTSLGDYTHAKPAFSSLATAKQKSIKARSDTIYSQTSKEPLRKKTSKKKSGLESDGGLQYGVAVKASNKMPVAPPRKKRTGIIESEGNEQQAIVAERSANLDDDLEVLEQQILVETYGEPLEMNSLSGKEFSKNDTTFKSDLRTFLKVTNRDCKTKLKITSPQYIKNKQYVEQDYQMQQQSDIGREGFWQDHHGENNHETPSDMFSTKSSYVDESKQMTVYSTNKELEKDRYVILQKIIFVQIKCKIYSMKL